MRSESGKRSINYLSVCLIIVIMTGASEIFSEKEIIFPEIAALAIGALAAPRQSWQVSRIRMVSLIAVCASLGIVIVRTINLEIWFQMAAAFAICQIIYLYSGTTFAPMISASVLPVLLRTESWIYPISAAILTVMICAVQIMVERVGLRPYESFKPIPKPDRYEIRDALIRILCVGAAAAPALLTDCRFCVAPPLLVAFTELSRYQSSARKKPVKVILLITFCAVSGAAVRMILSVKIGLPLTVSALAASVIMLILIHKIRLYLPPAGAMAILPMLLEESELASYPIQVFVGITVLTAAALTLFKIHPDRIKNKIRI